VVSPAGFALALLFFVLPFVAVSCDAGQAGSFDVSYSGFDLATGAQPSISASGSLAPAGGGPIDPGNAPDPGVHLLAILTAVFLLAGLVISLFGPVRIRLVGIAGAAVAAGGLLIWTEATAMSQLRTPVQNAILSQVQGTTEGMDAALDDAINTRIGFWLALAALILVLVFTVGVAVRNWVRK
jgi:hypothetical protein